MKMLISVLLLALASTNLIGCKTLAAGAVGVGVGAAVERERQEDKEKEQGR